MYKAIADIDAGLALLTRTKALHWLLSHTLTDRIDAELRRMLATLEAGGELTADDVARMRYLARHINGARPEMALRFLYDQYADRV